MNKTLTTQEIADLSSPVKLDTRIDPPAVAPVMSRRDKLLHWADIILASTMNPLALYHGIEHRSEAEYFDIAVHPHTAFALALADPLFRANGLTGSSIGDIKKFMELDRAELHAFSCDCGGHISNRSMADRIIAIAGRSPVTATMVDSASWTGFAPPSMFAGPFAAAMRRFVG